MTNEKKAGRKFIPERLRRVSRCITISPEAEEVVVKNTSAEDSPYQNNASRFIESKILGK